MIGFLSGIIKQVKGGTGLPAGRQAIILVGGVGYLVNITSREHAVVGASVELYIYTHVREDVLSLYGFSSEKGQALFEKFLSVSGIGPKSALAILSAAPEDEIIKAVSASNINFFTAVSGIGKKGAQKIIIDLKPKFARGDVDMKNLEGNSDLKSALLQLGFHNDEINTVLSKIDSGQPFNQQIKQALQLLKS